MACWLLTSRQTDGDEPLTPTAGGSGAAAAAAAFGEDGDGVDSTLLGTSPDAAQHGPGGGSFATRGASAIKQFRAPLEALFKRRGSGVPGSGGRDGVDGATSGGGALPAGLEARRAALLATLQGGGGGGGGLPCGKYLVEVDAHGE